MLKGECEMKNAECRMQREGGKRTRISPPFFIPKAFCILTLFVTVGCHQDMWNQPRAKAQSLSDSMFTDGSNSRLPVSGAIEFNKSRPDREFFTGYDKNGKLIKEFPVAVNEEFLKRGQNRFKIFCAPCHGELGDGNGFIAQRGFTLARPVGNYHSERLRNMPVGHFYDVVTNGYGTMFPFRSRIKPMDRWAIASYIRVLQESQHTSITSIPQDKQAELMAKPRTPEQDVPPELRIGAPPARELNTPGGATNPRSVRIVPLGRRGQPVPGAVEETTGTRSPDGSETTTPQGGSGR